jgi:hypothetical protein
LKCIFVEKGKQKKKQRRFPKTHKKLTQNSKNDERDGEHYGAEGAGGAGA